MVTWSPEWRADLDEVESALAEMETARGRHAAPRIHALSLDAEGALASLDWSAARLVPVDALRLLHLDHDVSALLDGGPAKRAPKRRAQYVAIFRSACDDRVKRLEISREGYLLLIALVSGSRLGDVAREFSPRLLYAWLREWVAEGLFVDVEPVQRSLESLLVA